MWDRFRNSRAISSEGLGALLVFIGLGMFVVVFLVVFPVLGDPVGAYDDWFPDDTPPVTTTGPSEAEEAAEPTAAFRFVAESTIEQPPEGEELPEGEEPRATYVVNFEDRSEPGDGEITSWTWDLGDGREARGPQVEHTYDAPGVYAVRLDVEDQNGMTSKVEGDVEVPDEGRSSDRVSAADDLDLSGIEAAVEDAVVALEDSVDQTLDSVGSAARSAAIVVLFALAAIATTVVAWRVTRSGIMLLRPTQEMRLKVRSAEMHVDVGKQPLEDAVDSQQAQATTATDRAGELVDV